MFNNKKEVTLLNNFEFTKNIITFEKEKFEKNM
jgi:hypothetical protein